MAIGGLRPNFGSTMSVSDGASIGSSLPIDAISTNVIPNFQHFDQPIVWDGPGVPSSEDPTSSLNDSLTPTGEVPEIVVSDKPFDWHDVQDQNYSLSQLMKDNPGLTPEKYLEFMSQHSDEWAEKYLDYLYEKQGIKEANEWTAQREDTAYQRLVQDLRKAGLNPALMYGGSASVQASGSAGVAGLSSGANSRTTTNAMKIKKLILDCILADWMIQHQKAQEGLDYFGKLIDLFDILN